eukprot:gene25850-11522_t
MSSVLRELEELRYRHAPGALKFRIPGDAYVAPSTVGGRQKSVDRLGRAIEAAEEEMDAALRRTNDVHRNQLKQKEMEALEMHHALAAKERSIESMRDTLSSTRRTYESKQMQLETALETRDAEFVSVFYTECVQLDKTKLEGTQRQMQERLAEQVRTSEELHLQQDDLRRTLLNKSEEASYTHGNLREERETTRSLQMELEDFRRKLSVLEGELLLQRRESAATKEHLELELEDAMKRYRSEKSIRKACEKWLKAELKSRDEYDMLLGTIRETASSGISMPRPATTLREVMEVERMEIVRRTAWQLADNKRRLKYELLATRKLVKDSLAAGRQQAAIEAGEGQPGSWQTTSGN